MSPIDLQDKIPGFRGSTTFFLSLQHNLSLTDANSPLPSPTSTPPSLRSSTTLLPPLSPPSPLSFSLVATPPSPEEQYSPSDTSSRNDRILSNDTEGSVKNNNVHISLVTSFSDKASALNILSYSIAEQRNLAFRALLTYPLHVFLLALLLFLLLRWTASSPELFHTHEVIWLGLAVLVGLITALACGVTMPYRRLAAEVGMDWLGGDEIIVAKRYAGGFTIGTHVDEKDVADGEEIVGVAVLAWRQGEGRLGRKGRRVGRGWIRGWAVCTANRGHGVGRSLLEEAAKTVTIRGGDGLYFDDHHAHSTLVLPAIYSGPFLRRDLCAQKTLAAAWDVGRCSCSRRRSGGR